MSNKEKALEIYNRHIALASTDGKLFRKTVMDEIMRELNASISSAATLYNTAKKTIPVDGLGRPDRPATAHSILEKKPLTKLSLKPENECFAVIEIVDGLVGRYQSFEMQGDASEIFDEKIVAWPNSEWIMIQGLGPNHGDKFSIKDTEKEIKRYKPKPVPQSS